MAIEKQNVIFAYCDGDAESLAIAQQYRDIHTLKDDQLVALPCSANKEILSSYSAFKEEIENPLKDAMATVPVSNYKVWAIVIGYRVPGGFKDGMDIISTTSRLSRINHAFSKKTNNPVFDRKTYKRFDEDDAKNVLICTRFDAPTLTIMEDWLKLSAIGLLAEQPEGIFYFDPYSAFPGAEAAKYQDILLNFEKNLLNELGLPVVSTTPEEDPYVDPFIHLVENDSFFWGWGSDSSSLDFFRPNPELRTFFYNADFDGAFSMRDIEARSWCSLCTRSGYIATAGAMSHPGFDGFIQPFPFFNSLIRGGTYGESVLFSNPYVDWTISSFGDPLLQFQFRFSSAVLGGIPVDEAWQRMEQDLSSAITFIYRKSLLVDAARELLLLSDDVPTTVDLFLKYHDLVNYFEEPGWRGDYVGATKNFISFITNRSRFRLEGGPDPSLDDYLEETSNKVHDILLDTLQDEDFKSSISDDNRYSEGSWRLDFELLNTSPNALIHYTFILEVSSSADFKSILISKDSAVDQTGWQIEDDDRLFINITDDGVGSNFSGRLVRYNSQADEELIKGNIYYFRIRQHDGTSASDPRDFRKIISR